LLRRPAEGGRQRRPRRRGHRGGRPRDPGPPAADQRRAPHPGGRGPALPADRDRAGPVPARGGARRRRGLRECPGHLRGRGAPDRHPARPPGGSGAAHPDRGPRPSRGGLRVTIQLPQVGPDGAPAAATPPALPVLPLKDSVTFPDTLTPLAVGQERSVRLVNDVLGGNRMLVMAASRDAELDEPGPDDLYDVGVVGLIARMMKVPDGTLRILVQGTQRVQLTDFVATEPYLVARIEEQPDILELSSALAALKRNVQNTFSQIIEQTPYLPEEMAVALANLDDPSELAHMIAGSLRISVEEKQKLLEERDVAKRLRLLSQYLARELDVISLGTKIQTQVQSEVHGRRPRSEEGSPDPRSRSLRHPGGEGPDPRVPGRSQAQAGRALLDPLLRGAAGRGQDLARPLDRACDGSRVRAHLGGRRARRVRDPRPPAHLHRSHARRDHPLASRRGRQQPRADDRRDRQDGRGLPRRPRQR